MQAHAYIHDPQEKLECLFAILEFHLLKCQSFPIKIFTLPPKLKYKALLTAFGFWTQKQKNRNCSSISIGLVDNITFSTRIVYTSKIH